MELQSVVERLTSFLSPTPQTDNTTRRLQPHRNARKKPDENFIYPGHESSLILGSTLTESQLQSGNAKVMKDLQDKYPRPKGIVA